MALDEATEQLLHELRESPTDLAKLVVRTAHRCRAVLPISADAVARWNKDDPDSWGRVRAWLTTRVVGRIMVGTTLGPDV